MPALHRILIANRGEIAMRIIHACHDTGRIAIAAYATPDADALFVRQADEAYALHGSDAKSTYLNIDAIIVAAKQAHADAVHPGYGFLAENADFAQAVIDAGITWIGPQPATIRKLGSKVEARRIAAEVGAPMAPGTTEPVHDPAEVVAFAQQYGLPLAIKAVYGGGGRGLKVVRKLEDVREAFVSATHEAELAFGNGDCFIERFLDRPRHVEVQVLGDHSGNIVAVGTRDCSLQRRNQKLIEEAPAPFLPAEIMRKLEDSAVAICGRAQYESAGTVEFLVDPDGTMSFMEVNTRIQVEHPVTEAVTGVDVVAAQLAIAEGAHITDIPGLESGKTPVAQGHAIEFRINAEDPSLGFVPFPGVVEGLRVPTGPGIRFDSGVVAGGAIPGQFDSMIAKLIVSAPSRELCLTRARYALRELAISGVPTVRAFDQAVLEQPAFVAKDCDFGVYTRWIEEEFLPSVDVRTLADGSADKRASSPDPIESWVEVDGRRVRLGLPASFAAIAALGAGLESAAGAAGSASRGASHVPNVSDSAESVIQRVFFASRMSDSGESDKQNMQTGAWMSVSPESDKRNGNKRNIGTPIESTITGTIVRWLADDGSRVNEGDPIVVLEAMKMETEISASTTGILRQTLMVGENAQYGDFLGAIC
ncbi:biotin carboxylase N-terminal domain-containing protein [uncultured Bifidobacterium sp.]|uniref:acetyl/propionyl/methylcrotonyl-CoA carboxylase subunit alpha n=1 Tax=uncultured Bifidobacterium sp. TaxID=165187 RepID=UPI002584584F|nr:biotin carboxylase N-terminal domain-containing protein [uncultured Bifidobacterium sp.]